VWIHFLSFIWIETGEEPTLRKRSKVCRSQESNFLRPKKSDFGGGRGGVRANIRAAVTGKSDHVWSAKKRGRFCATPEGRSRRGRKGRGGRRREDLPSFKKTSLCCYRGKRRRTKGTWKDGSTKRGRFPILLQRSRNGGGKKVVRDLRRDPLRGGFPKP